MNDKLKVGLVLVIALAIVGWSIAKSSQSLPGAVGNNGYVTEFPAPSPDLQKSMENMMRKGPPPGAMMRDPSNPQDREAMQLEVEKQLDPKQREEFRKFSGQMRERMERTRAMLGPDDSMKLMQKFMRSGAMRRGFGRPQQSGNDAPKKP